MKALLPICLLLVTIVSAAEPPKPSWKAGAAIAKITPQKMIWMAGYASRTKPAEGVEQDLFAKALVIEDHLGSKFALITTDLVGVPREVRLFVAEEVQKRYGIDAAHLAINASHTHSGPELRSSRLYGTDDPPRREAEAAEYTDLLQQAFVRIVGEAIDHAVPATLNYCKARCGFAMNRRTPNGQGGWNNSPNPDGPVDHSVPVLKVTDEADKEIALVFGYACHCTTLGHQKFSGDYAGYAQEYLQAAHPGVTAMFMNGCSGDQNPYPRRTVELAQNHGRSLATAVEAALTTKLVPITGPLKSAYQEIQLAYDTLPTRDQLVDQQKSTNKLDAAHAGRVLEVLDLHGKLPQDYPYPVQVLRLGNNLTWVMLAGEVVIDYSLRLKSEIKDPIVWVSAYTNDVPTYIPSLRVWKEGGYEGGDAMKWGSHPTRWNPKVEEHIISTVHALRGQLD